MRQIVLVVRALLVWLCMSGCSPSEGPSVTSDGSSSEGAKRTDEIRTTEFNFLRADACALTEHDPYGPDRMTLERRAGRVVATIYHGMPCGHVAANPRVEYTSEKVTLLVSDIDLVPDAAAACLCADRITFELAKAVPKGMPVFFSSDGTNTVDGIAP